MNDRWQAIAREAGLAAAHIGIGATALGHANYAQTAYYYQAFFALSLGFERTAKLAIVVDHAIENGGAFPSHKVLRSYGHRLDQLLKQTDEIASRREMPLTERLPNGEIHRDIIAVLSDFASNVTRYYNLDFLTGDPRTASHRDVVSQWHTSVTQKVIKRHYTERSRTRDTANAAFADALLRGVAGVIHTSETGEAIRSVGIASLHGAATSAVRPFTRMYVLQIARFLAFLMSALSYASHASDLDSIPHLSDFYAIFNNDDKYFLQRKGWSIYRLR